jgi:integrase
VSLYKKPGSPFWWYSITRDDDTRIRKSTKIRHDAPSKDQQKENRRFALEIEHDARISLNKRARQAPEKPSIGISDYLVWYEAHVAAHHKGYIREASMLKQIREALGNSPLRELTKERLLEWRTARAKQVSAGTVNRERDLLVAALNAAVPTYLEQSPAQGLKRLPHRSTPPAVLSREDEGNILAVLEPPDRAIIIAAIDTLARAGDLARLTWADDHGAYLSLRDPKTGNPYEVPISKRLRAALDAMSKQPGAIFSHRQSGNGRPMEFWRMLREACLKAGVTAGRKQGGLTFHALRHTGATRLAAAGVDLRTLQALGGWSSLKQIARYAHPTQSHMVAAVETIGKGVRVTKVKRWRRR